jgi:hypothetical protein
MTNEVISPLRRRMIEDMTIRKLSPKTQIGYIRHVKNFAAFVGRSPDTATTRRCGRVSSIVPWSVIRPPLAQSTLPNFGGDRFAGIWPVEQFRKSNIRYEQSAEPKSDLYQSLLPLINLRRIDLLDNPKLINQLIGLERRTARSGRDSIDHVPGGHDDICNAVAGLASAANRYIGNSFLA